MVNEENKTIQRYIENVVVPTTRPPIPYVFHSKQMRSLMDLIIKDLKDIGVEFFSCTVNTYGMFLTPELAWEAIKVFKDSLRAGLEKDLSLIGFLYIAVEEHSAKRKLAGWPHLHMLIGIRSLTGLNFKLGLAIEKSMINQDILDYKVDYLKKFIDAKEFWNYCLKNFEQFYKHHEIHSYDPVWSVALAHYVNKISITEYGFVDIRTGWDTRWPVIQGLKTNIAREISPTVIFHLWDTYLKAKNYKVYQDQIYGIDSQSKCSVRLMHKISYLYDNFREVFQFLSLTFPEQFLGIGLSDILIKYLHTAYERLIKNTTLIECFTVNFPVLEFKDGLYISNLDLFLAWEELPNEFIETHKFFAFKYYDVNYKHLRTPNYWLEQIKKQIKEPNQLAAFFNTFGALLHTKQIQKKDQTLFVLGGPNTGKTSLIAHPLITHFGVENIGLLNSVESNFTFADTIGKQIVIVDEFKYNDKIRSNILNLMQGTATRIEVKHRQSVLLENKSPWVLLTNHPVYDEAFKKRIQEFYFKSSYGNTKSSPALDRERVLSELPKILVFCNKMYLKGSYGHYASARYLKQNVLKQIEANPNHKLDIWDLNTKPIA